MQETESGFKERLLNRSNGAYHKLYQEYCPTIRTILKRYGVPVSDLSNVEQEVVLKILRSIDGVHSFRAWLCVVTRRTAIRFMRRRDACHGGSDAQDVLQSIPSRDSLPQAAFDEIKDKMLQSQLADVMPKREWRIYQGLLAGKKQSVIAKELSLSEARVSQLTKGYILPLIQKVASEL